MRPLFSLLFAVLTVNSAQAADRCGALFAGRAALPAEASWRAASTNTDPATGSVAATNARREAYIRETEAWQVSMIDGTMLQKTDTPPMYFVAEAGARVNELVRSGGLNGVITRIAVTGLGPSGILRGTMLLPVSGHNGLQSARVWARQDKFDVTAQVGTGSAGDQFGSYGGGAVIVRNGQSRDLVTKQEMSIQLVAGREVRVVYNRHGSLGPAGYPEGRLMIFTWDGN